MKCMDQERDMACRFRELPFGARQCGAVEGSPVSSQPNGETLVSGAGFPPLKGSGVTVITEDTGRAARHAARQSEWYRGAKASSPWNEGDGAFLYFMLRFQHHEEE